MSECHLDLQVTRRVGRIPPAPGQVTSGLQDSLGTTISGRPVRLECRSLPDPPVPWQGLQALRGPLLPSTRGLSEVPLFLIWRMGRLAPQCQGRGEGWAQLVCGGGSPGHRVFYF